MECRDSILNLTFGTTRTAELSALCAGHTVAPRKFLGNHFWTPRLLKMDRRNRLLENFQRPYRESNLEPPVLGCSASTNHANTPFHLAVDNLMKISVNKPQWIVTHCKVLHRAQRWTTYFPKIMPAEKMSNRFVFLCSRTQNKIAQLSYKRSGIGRKGNISMANFFYDNDT
jgi:hypothetical protein